MQTESGPNFKMHARCWPRNEAGARVAAGERTGKPGRSSDTRTNFVSIGRSLRNHTLTVDVADFHQAPDFALNDLGNQPIKLSELKGKVVLLDFWATWCAPCPTWCAPCRAALPDLELLNRDFKDKGLVVYSDDRTLMIALEATGWSGFAATLLAPALLHKYFLILCGPFVLLGLHNDYWVALRRTDPTAVTARQTRALLREYERTGA